MSITEGTQPAAVTWTGAWTTNQTTSSFTPESGALLVALVAGDGNTNSAITDAVSDSLGGTWTLLKRQNAVTATLGGVASVWCRDSPGASLTVSAKNNNELGAGSTGGQLVVRTLIGAKAAASQNGATGGASPSTGAVQVSVAAGTGGRIYGAAFNYDNSTAMSALANTSVINAFADSTNGDDWEAFKSSADTSGTATYGYSTSHNGMIAAAEILAAPAGGGAAPAAPGRTWLRRFHHRQALAAVPLASQDVSATAEVATSTVIALAAVVAVTANAGVATVGVVAPQPSVAVTATAGVAAVSVVAPAPTTAVTANAGVATVGVVALAPSTAVTTTAGVAITGVVATAPTTAVTATAGVAVVGAVAPAASAAITATAGVAITGVVAPAPTTAVTVNAGVAIIGAVAPQPTVNTSGSTNAPAAVAPVQVAALAPVAAGGALPAAAASTAVALAPSVQLTARAAVAVIGVVAPPVPASLVVARSTPTVTDPRDGTSGVT